jgi:hypothetical protein
MKNTAPTIIIFTVVAILLADRVVVWDSGKKLDMLEGKIEYRFATPAEVEAKKRELEKNTTGQETGNIWKPLESFFPCIEEKTISDCRYRFYYLKKGGDKFVAVYQLKGQFQIFTSSMIYVDRAVPLTDEYGWGTVVSYHGRELTLCADSGDNFYVAVVPKE